MSANLSTSQLGSSASNASHAQPTDFERFYALDQLVRELFTFFGWFEGSVDRENEGDTTKTVKGVSIFAGTLPVEREVSYCLLYT